MGSEEVHSEKGVVRSRCIACNMRGCSCRREAFPAEKPTDSKLFAEIEIAQMGYEDATARMTAILNYLKGVDSRLMRKYKAVDRDNYSRNLKGKV